MTSSEQDEVHATKMLGIVHFLTTLALVAGAVIFILDIRDEARQLRVQFEAYQATTDRRLDEVNHRITSEVSRTADDLNHIRGSIQRMEDRMERLMERTLTKEN